MKVYKNEGGDALSLSSPLSKFFLKEENVFFTLIYIERFINVRKFKFFLKFLSVVSVFSAVKIVEFVKGR